MRSIRETLGTVDPKLRFIALALALGTITLNPACTSSDDDGNSDDDGDTGGSENGSGGRDGSGGGNEGGEGGEGGGGESKDPLYVFLAQVEATEEVYVSYLVTAPSLDAGTVVSPTKGIEKTYGNAFGFDGTPEFWLTVNDSPTVERWTIGSDDRLQLDETISFGNLGFKSAHQLLWWGKLVTPELGVGPNNAIATGELVRWNPTTMELIGTLPLDLPLPTESSSSYLLGNPRVRPDGTIIAGYSCSTYAPPEEEGAQPTYEACTGVVVFNKDATKIIGRDEYVGCEAILPNHGTTTPDGTTYFGPSGYTLDSVEGVPEELFNCTLRVLPGETEFDDEYGARDAFEGSGQISWFHGFGRFIGDYAVFPMFEGDDEWETPSARWYRWDLESEQPELLGGENDGFIHPEAIPVDGRLFFAGEESNGTTQFYEVTEDAIVPAFSVSGSAGVATIVRLR